MKPSTHRIRRGLQDLAPAMYRERLPLTNLRILPLGVNIAPEDAPIPAQDIPGWRPIAPGARWGGQDHNAWFHGEAQVPTGWRAQLGSARHSVALRLLLGESPDFGWPEGLLYINGALLQGINQHHPDALLPDSVLTANRSVIRCAGLVRRRLARSPARVRRDRLAQPRHRIALPSAVRWR